MEGLKSQYLQNQHRGLVFGSLNFSDHLGLEVSSNKNADMENLALKDLMKGKGTVEGGLVESEHVEHRRHYPLRPKAVNCLFFIRYGWCKFGGNCRYNHPFNRRSQAEYKEIAKLNEEKLNRMEQVECKYYLTPEGCKHGKACRYNHCGQKTEKAPVLEFNFLGLPIRQGEKECPQYRRSGSCKYGSKCWFDHPDPSSMGEGFPLSAYTGWEDAMPYWPLAGQVNGFGPFKRNMYQPPQCAPYSEWIACQRERECPRYTQSGSCKYGSNCWFYHPDPSSMGEGFLHSGYTGWEDAMPFWPSAGIALNGFSQVETNMYQPAQCAPRSDWIGYQQQQQQPTPNRLPGRETSSCPADDKGLPLRPDTEVCAFHNRYGVCKHGAGCKFDHPVPRADPVCAADTEEAQLPGLATEDNN